MGLKQQLKKLVKTLPPGGRVFWLREGEQVAPSHEHPGNLVFMSVRRWRAEGAPMPEGIETIPGYQRPANWRAIEAEEDKQAFRMEVE